MHLTIVSFILPLLNSDVGVDEWELNDAKIEDDHTDEEDQTYRNTTTNQGLIT